MMTAANKVAERTIHFKVEERMDAKLLWFILTNLGKWLSTS